MALPGQPLVAAEKIEIGSRTVVGANVTIVDTDFHPLVAHDDSYRDNSGKSAPVCIGDDVFIGMNALILKGVTIGNGAVIGAGSVVATNIPAFSVAAGNPAKVIKQLKHD